MLSSHQIRTLTSALTGLIGLVSLSAVLLLTSAFLYPADEQPANPVGGAEARSATAANPAPLTEEQLRGKTLFTNNCAQCHAATNEVIVGPGLKGVTSRTPGEAWLMKWIRNSQAVVASGDAYAVRVYGQFNKIAMSSFPNLTDADIKAILSYIDGPAAPAAARP